MSALLTDWQFWVVTLVALGAAAAIVRPFLARRKAGNDAACPHCAAGNACATKKADAPAGERLVTLGAGRRSG